MISRRIVINVITFLVLSAILIAALMVNIFRIQPKYSVYGIFPNTGGAFSGQEVTYRGVTVGRIGNIELVPEGVRMELVIEADYDEIPEDARARVMFKSAVGEQFVDLLPQSRTPPYLDQGDVIPMSRTEVPVQQEELLRLLNQVLEGVPPEAIGGLVDTLGTGLGGRGEELSRALAALDPITEVFANRTGELNRINVNADRLGDAFDRSAEEFVAGVRALADVADSLARVSGDTEELLEVGARELPAIAGLVAARKQAINETIHNLRVVTGLNFDHLESVRDVLDPKFGLPGFMDVIVASFDVERRRLRFGQVMDEMGNRPCDYGTPRRPTDVRSGNAEYHPILDFTCEATG